MTSPLNHNTPRRSGDDVIKPGTKSRCHRPAQPRCPGKTCQVDAAALRQRLTWELDTRIRIEHSFVPDKMEARDRVHLVAGKDCHLTRTHNNDSVDSSSPWPRTRSSPWPRTRVISTIKTPTKLARQRICMRAGHEVPWPLINGRRRCEGRGHAYPVNSSENPLPSTRSRWAGEGTSTSTSTSTWARN